jgi:hypothetical protein
MTSGGNAAAAAPCLAWNRDDSRQDELVRKAFRRHTARPQRTDSRGIRRCGARRFWVGASFRSASPLRIWAKDRLSESPPRRAAVRAVLEVGQPIGPSHDRRCGRGRCQSASAPKVAVIRRLRAYAGAVGRRGVELSFGARCARAVRLRGVDVGQVGLQGLRRNEKPCGDALVGQDFAD